MLICACMRVCAGVFVFLCINFLFRYNNNNNYI